MTSSHGMCPHTTRYNLLMIGSPVVLDTNVLVAAAFRPTGNAAWIIQRIRSGELRMVWHRETRAETRAVLDKIPPIHWSDFAGLYRREEEWTQPMDLDGLACIADPSDRKFAALAKASGAVVISQDDHLLSCRNRLPLDVLRPGELVGLWKSGDWVHKP